MPRIRKKTSKRGTTNDRRKVTQKVRESRKKKAKAAKKNVEWKSKHKKDPGIPNTFPYKDQILAEVAEQRRLAEEDKQRRKDEKRALKSSSADETQNPEAIANGDDGFDGIASISAKRLTAKATRKPVTQAEDSDEEEEDEAPLLINKDLKNLRAVLDQADVVCEVLDARDPLAFRSSHLEEFVRSKSERKTMLVLNKIDCAPQEAVTSWLSVLRNQLPTFPFRSTSSLIPGNPLIPSNSKGKGKSKDPVDDALGADAILECLSKWANEKNGDGPFTVAVIGITNTGKSSLINSLIKKDMLSVYTLASSSRGPTTTTIPQEVTTEMEGKIIRFIDTPGIAWETDKVSLEANEVRYRDILLRNKGRIDRLKDPLGPVAHLVSRANSEDLMLLYSLPVFPKGDVDAFISGVARSQQLVRKRGALDLTGASKLVLRDWCIGKIRWYSTPPSDITAGTTKSSADDWLESHHTKADGILAHLESRKDMRKVGGVVKISSGQVDPRKVLVDMMYDEEEESSDEEGEEEEEMAADQEGFGEEDDDEGSEDDDEDDEDEDEETEIVPYVAKSQKRKRVTHRPLSPNKKVTFAAGIMGSKGKYLSTGSANSKRSKRRLSENIIPSAKKATKSALKKA